MPLSLFCFRLLVTFCICSSFSLLAQRGGPRIAVGAMGGQGTLPAINVGGGSAGARFARLDFATMMLASQSKEQKQKLVESGIVSALDLEAPSKALDEFNQAADLMRDRKAEPAAKHLEKAIGIYPNFVSAHNNLGIVYLILTQNDQAESEFKAAMQLDARFPGSYVNLGKMALARQDYPNAELQLQKAADLLPHDAKVLTVLTFAQNGNGDYAKAIDTAVRIHGMEHKQLAKAHYVAAAAAVSMNDYPTAQREFALFLHEDPKNPLAPVARHSMEVLARQPVASNVKAVDPGKN